MFQLGSVTLASSEESEARENEVKNFFTQRINQLVAQRQLADGKSTSLQAEVNTLIRNLTCRADIHCILNLLNIINIRYRYSINWIAI
jgi:Tfp pilus assembly protein PilO